MFLTKKIIDLLPSEKFKIQGVTVSVIDLTECDFDFKQVKIKESHLITGLIDRYGSDVGLPNQTESDGDGGVVFADEVEICEIGPFLLMGKVEVKGQARVGGLNTMRIPYLSLEEL